MNKLWIAIYSKTNRLDDCIIKPFQTKEQYESFMSSMTPLPKGGKDTIVSNVFEIINGVVVPCLDWDEAKGSCITLNKGEAIKCN